MGFNDFWINNNGKKEQLGEVKHGVRKEQVDKKYHNLFDAYDSNKDGTLETSELGGIFSGLSKFAGEDKILDSKENDLAMSLFAGQSAIKDADFMGFVKSVSDSSADIISSEEKELPNGEKEIKTQYKDGTTETITYYADGGFKYKKIDKKFKESHYEIIENGKKRVLTENEFKSQFNKFQKQSQQPQFIERVKTRDGIPVYIAPTSKNSGSNVQLNSWSNEWEDHKTEYSDRYEIETVLKDLGLDLNSEDGKKISERLSKLPLDTLHEINKEDLKSLIKDNELEPTFDNVSNVLELVYGVTLRTDEEFKANQPKLEKIVNQIQSAALLQNLCELVSTWNDQYTDSIGLFGMGTEGIGYLTIKLGKLFGADWGSNHYQMADAYKGYAENVAKLPVLNPEKFAEKFSNVYGEDTKGNFKYDEQAFKKLFDLVQQEKAYKKDENGNVIEITDEFKDVMAKAVNFTADNPNESMYNQVMNGLGEALIMIMTLGWAAEAKGGQMLATSTIGTFSKLGAGIASKQVNNKLLQGALRFTGKGVKLIGPALNEGTKMATYTFATGTATNIFNRGIKFDQENTLEKFAQVESQIGDATVSSFEFGAFAGVFGSTITQKVLQKVQGVSSKVTSALSKNFAKGSVEAGDVYTTILEKSVPEKLVEKGASEVAAFCTDVLGFSAFEVASTIVKKLDVDQMTPENIEKLLKEELPKEIKNQSINIFQIKLVSWMLASRSGRMQSRNYLKDNFPQLKGATVEQNGKGYKINLADGRKIECKNANEMIASLHLMARNETAFSSKFDVKQDVKKGQVETPKTHVQEAKDVVVEQDVKPERMEETNVIESETSTEKGTKKPYVAPRAEQVELQTKDEICASDNEVGVNPKGRVESKQPKTSERKTAYEIEQENLHNIEDEILAQYPEYTAEIENITKQIHDAFKDRDFAYKNLLNETISRIRENYLFRKSPKLSQNSRTKLIEYLLEKNPSLEDVVTKLSDTEILDKYNDIRTEEKNKREAIKSNIVDRLRTRADSAEVNQKFRDNELKTLSTDDLDILSKLIESLDSNDKIKNSQLLLEADFTKALERYNNNPTLKDYPTKSLVKLLLSSDSEYELKLSRLKNRDELIKTLDDTELDNILSLSDSDYSNLLAFTKIIPTKHNLKGVKINDLIDLAEAHKDDSKTIETLLNDMEKSSWSDSVYPRYSIEDIINISKAKKENPELVKSLLAEKWTNYDGEEVPRFGSKDIKTIVELSRENSELVTRLINDKNIDTDGNESSRFDGRDIETLVELSRENPELVTRLINERTIDYKGKENYRFKSYEIKNLVELSKENSEFVNSLLSEKTTNSNGQKCARFTAYDIESIIESSKENPELVKSLLVEKKTNYDGEESPRFSASDIKDIINLEREYPDLVNSLLNEKMEINRHITSRFDAYEITSIIEASKDNLELVKSLLSQKIVNRDGKQEPRFKAYDIKKIIELSQETNSEIVESLLNEKTITESGDETFRFNNATEISDLAYRSKSKPDWFKTLLNKKIVREDGKEVPRFTGNEIKDIMGTSSEFRDFVNSLLDEKITDDFGKERPRFNGHEIKKLTFDYANHNSEIINYLLNEKFIGEDGKERYRFTGAEIDEIHNATLLKSKQKKLKILIDMKAENGQPLIGSWEMVDYLRSSNLDEIITMLSTKNTNGTNRFTKSFVREYTDGKVDDSIMNFADKITNENGIQDYTLSLDNSNRYKDSYIIVMKNTDNNSTDYIVFDKNGNILNKGTTQKVEKETINIFTNDDGSQVRYSAKDNETNSRLSTREVTDSEGKLLYTERYVPSSVEGKFDIIREVDGRTYKIGLAEKTPSGHLIIEKTFDLETGTKTDGVKAKQSYTYIEDPNGNRLTYIVVKDVDGKELLNQKMVYKKIDENHYVTKENDKTYDIQYFDDKVVVQRSDGKQCEISIGENARETEGVISRDLIPLLKKAPGSAYFAIAETGLTKIEKGGDAATENACYSSVYNSIAMSNELSGEDSIFVFLHELGHALDYNKGIHDNPELLKIYEEERNNLLNNASLTEFDDMSYFVSATHMNEGGAITEMIAESNALLSATNHWGKIEHRGELLQQYFPRTFAKIVELLRSN